MEHYMDEKWKITSKDDKNSHWHNSSSGKSSSLPRSVSQRGSTTKSLKNPFNLSRSASQKSASTKSSLSRSSSQRCSEFTRKCSSLAKEQKAKFYIVKRCITMLVSWKKNGDS
ncbi:UNVERIFIED_CONTAM: hypothetical protein Scaly_0380300 [Sesamum calycinum]|uniref:Uncharacterized protein LOC105170841 n=4 Tax=Sesamum TaxID=4181 RepID=A0A6I9TVI2_SESIN|nr:uncharacterized protein LOC105170841 [Sesamum indicum]